MAGVFNSQWRGSQIDGALGVIIESGVTAGQLAVLKGLEFGVAVAGKAVVLDESKSFTGVTLLQTESIKSGVLVLTNRSTDPSANPETGFTSVYVKGGGVYTKNSAGVVSRVGGGEEKEFAFSNAFTVTCTHNFGSRYPMVDVVGSDNMKLEGQVLYQNENTVVVTFNSSRSGRVFVRKL